MAVKGKKTEASSSKVIRLRDNKPLREQQLETRRTNLKQRVETLEKKVAALEAIIEELTTKRVSE